MTVAVPLEHPVKDRLFTPVQRAFWEENGYVIIPDAVPQENLEAVIEAIWAFLQVDRDDPETWYDAPGKPRRHAGDVSPPVPLGQSPAPPRFYQAFADVWQQEELWVSIDRANMKPAGAHARLGL